MRVIGMAAALVTLVSCGAPSGSGGEAAKADEKTTSDKKDSAPVEPKDESPAFKPAQLVNTAADLPPCTVSTDKWIIYVAADKELQACQNGAWVVVDLAGLEGPAGPAGPAGATGATGDQGVAGTNGTNGTNGTDGVAGATGATGEVGQNGEDGSRIAAVDAIVSGIANLCTRYSNETCFLSSGLVTRYSSGLIAFSGLFAYSIEFDIGGGFYDTDHDWKTTMPFYCAMTDEWCSARLRGIARTGSDDEKSLWLIYKPALDQFSLVFDIDDDGVYEATDEVIEVLTTESTYVDEE